jgi:hypothetical protein
MQNPGSDAGVFVSCRDTFQNRSPDEAKRNLKQFVIPGRAAWRGPQMCNRTSGNPYSRSWLWIPGSMLRIAPE